MRSLSRLLLVVAFCLIAIAFPSVPAQAECVLWAIELSPESAAPGTEVTVYGHHFDEGRPIDLYYDGVRVSEGRETDNNGEFYITFIVPEDCTGHYWVLARVGSSLGIVEADRLLAVKPGLMVSPEKGPAGTTVTVKGRGFAKNEQDIELMYYLNDSYETIERNISANANGSWERSFQVPASTRGEHKLDAQGAESSLYEVHDAVFRVTAEITIDKSSGIEGDTVTMSGSKFAAYENGIMILLDDQAVVTDIKANSYGEWEESFQVPKMPAGEYSITVEGEQTSKEDVGDLSFEIKPEFILSHDQGHVGMDLTVTGRGFPAYEDIIILYDDSQVATAETDDQGTFEVSFSVPESKHGEHLVRARPTEGTNNTADLEINASATFTMESDPPPIPEQISPADRSRLGFFSEVAPTFEWAEVSDESGVAYYSLQIATSADFTTSSLLVSVTGLTETSYTLQETEALPLGTYYWIVQAVDDAENESGWSANHSFRVGLLPKWGFIAVIVGAVILLIALIRALLKRRTIFYDGW
jgi:hypothetical protein